MEAIIKRIKFFFDVLVKSLTKFDFYNEIKKAKFNFSLKYLFLLFYVVSLITTLVLAVSASVFVFPNLPKFISTIESKASSYYPNNLVVNIKNGIVTTNEKEPYSIDTLNSLGLNKGYDHLITIDTKADPGTIKDDKTMILVTKDSFVLADSSDNSYRVYQIDPSTNITINQNSYNKLVSQIEPNLKYLEPGLVVLLVLLILIGPFIGAALSLVFQLIYLLIFSAIFFLVVKLMKKKLEFKKVYQLSMHASTLPILLTFVAGSLGIQEPFLLGSAILLVFMILVVNHLT